MTKEVIAGIIAGLFVASTVGIFKIRKSVWSKIKDGHRWTKRKLRRRKARAEYIDLAISTHEALRETLEALYALQDFYNANYFEDEDANLTEYQESIEKINMAQTVLSSKIIRLLDNEWKGISGNIGYTIRDEPDSPIDGRKKL